jgi:hypothetical protein
MPKCRAFPLFLAVLLAAGIAAAPRAGAQVPDLLAVPASLPRLERDALAKRRDALAARLTAMEQDAVPFRAACGSVDKGSAAAERCRIRFGELNNRRLQYVADANAFNNDVRGKVAHYEKFPEVSSPYQFSGRGLVGGVGWETAPYAFNAPDSLTPERRAEAERNFERNFERMLKLTGLERGNVIDPSRYNFIIGLAVSSEPLNDVARRALWDNLKAGRATPALQQQYELLRGRSFEPLDCHSNGAMICLGALANNDIAAKRVRLFGPQVTPGALEEWQSLLKAGKVGSVEIFIAEGDPIPPVTYGARYLIPTTRSTDTALKLTAAFMASAGLLKREFENDAPRIKVTTIPCQRGALEKLKLECHEMTHYQNSVR